MDLEPLVRRAGAGDVASFETLTRRFQHFAFGTALALVGDRYQAEDVAQEAFLAAWQALPSLAEPAAFPGWLRGIVRHHAFRLLRRRHFDALPLDAAQDVASDEPAADELLAARRKGETALAALAALPPALREAATLFYQHECSQQDVATFLGLPVATVNNRLHAARLQLKQRMLAMVTETLKTEGLSDDFANRIGRLVAARGRVVEALFAPDALPDLLAELAVSDESGRRGVAVQVIQRPGCGIVRALAATPIDGLPRGATVLSTGQASGTALPVGQSLTELTGPGLTAGTLLETGIKAIDVLCPLTKGGSVVLAGGPGVGLTVLMEELVRRLGGSGVPLSLFVVLPPSPASVTAELKREGYSEGTVGAVQTFFFRGDAAPWTAATLESLAPADAVLHLSHATGPDRIYPAIDPLTSRSRLLEKGAVGADHAAVAGRVRAALAALRDPGAGPATIELDRARKLRQFFGQPFFVAEPYTKRPGTYVALAETLAACRDILDGRCDDLPAEALAFAGSLAEIRAR